MVKFKKSIIQFLLQLDLNLYFNHYKSFDTHFFWTVCWIFFIVKHLFINIPHQIIKINFYRDIIFDCLLADLIPIQFFNKVRFTVKSDMTNSIGFGMMNTFVLLNIIQTMKSQGLVSVVVLKI